MGLKKSEKVFVVMQETLRGSVFPVAVANTKTMAQEWIATKQHASSYFIEIVDKI
jgi:hypothetical protein